MKSPTLDDLLRELEEYETPPPPTRRPWLRKPWSRGTKLLVMFLVGIALAGGAIGVTTLFTHTFPATPVGAARVMSSACANATLTGYLPSSLLTGTAGSVLYNCGPTGSSAPAFHANAGTATPTFTLPSGAGTVALSYVTHSATAVSCSGGTTITSGSTTTFVAGDYDYCLSYTSYPSSGIPSFTLTWTQ